MHDDVNDTREESHNQTLPARTSRTRSDRAGNQPDFVHLRYASADYAGQAGYSRHGSRIVMRISSQYQVFGQASRPRYGVPLRHCLPES
jgi:hypothetical protein